MPWIEDDAPTGFLGLPQGLNLTPDPEAAKGSVLGAAFRSENPIVSAATSFSFDPTAIVDPDYRPWEALQGSKYEPYADRFVGARNTEDVARMKLQIDQELEDDAVLQAAGWKGVVAQMGAGLLSPTTLLPGGAIYRGAKGVSIGKTALSVSLSAGAAAAIDEAFLQSTQQTRTGQESAFAIGGSVILGGFLGAAAGKIGQVEFKAAAKQAEEAMVRTEEYNEVFRSLSAGSALDGSLKLRGEEAFQAIKSIPFLRVLVGTDPILRTALSDLDSARRGLVDMVETPLEYKVNAEGRSVRGPDGSVEARINVRERNELAGVISGLSRSYSEYWRDGPVGLVGTITAPITSRFANLMNKTEKMGYGEYMDEVGRAARSGDKHPIPQVQTAAEFMRKTVFDKIKQDAIDVGLFDKSLNLDNEASYFTRVYNDEKILQNWGTGNADDLEPVLRAEFMKRRERAQTMLAEDDTLNRLEIEQLRLREDVSQNKKTLGKATEKARAKRERAKSSIQASTATGRATGALRRLFEARASGLSEGVLDDASRAALKEAVSDARGMAKLEPMSLLQAIRAKGGIADPRAGGRWNGKGWSVGAQKTDIETILDTKAISIRRKDGREIDHMRKSLVEDGYLPEGATVNDLLDAISREAFGQKVYSELDQADLARFEAARDFRDELQALGADVSDPLDTIVRKVGGPNNSKVQKAKAGEAGRAAKAAGKSEDAANAKVLGALDRLEEAKSRLREIDDEVGPKVRGEIKAALKELDRVKSEIRTVKAGREKEDFYASATDAEIATHVRETIQSILSMKPGDSAMSHAFASPTRARVLDVSDEILEPWLESNAETIMNQYFRSMVPQIEMMRTFGDLEGTRVLQEMTDEAAAKIEKAKTAKEKKRLKREMDSAVRDFSAMRDRILGRYGQPDNPRSAWVKAARATRTVSYMGYLGVMTLSAIPDVAGVIGRSGIEGSFGTAATALMDPKRFFRSVQEAAEFGASAEWYLNSRAIAMSDVFDRYGRGSKMERLMAEGARNFSVATGMIPWNVGWKSVGGAAVASRMAKAADAVAQGKGSRKQLRFLAANGIEPWMAERIAKQIDQFGDKDGMLWLPQGGKWQDREAFEAFRRAMNREFDMMVITPGQDKPLAFSTETGKFFLQFKSFGFSAYHRILIAGLQRADADVLAQFTTALLLGGLVSNIKADLGGYDRKEGNAFWADALDRSGLTGWMMEPYGMAAATFPQLAIGEEAPSRFQARSKLAGALGPSVDMIMGVGEASAAMARGEQSYRDVRKLMRPLPGNNHPMLNGTYVFNLYSRLEDALVEMTGAKPRN